jgi:hypothetical protein
MALGEREPPHGNDDMTDLTKLARGRDCQIRVPGYCAPGPENEAVVACHVRLLGISGMSLKAPDFMIAFGCAPCHAVVDGQRGSWVEFPQILRDLMLFEGCFRTQAILFHEGYLWVKGAK